LRACVSSTFWVERKVNMLFLQELSDGAQSGPVPERPQRGQFRRAIRNGRAMPCSARQMALAERVRMSWVQWRRSLRRHARRAAIVPVQRVSQADLCQSGNDLRFKQAAAAHLVQGLPGDWGCQAATSACGSGSLAGWNLCPKPVPSVPLYSGVARIRNSFGSMTRKLSVMV